MKAQPRADIALPLSEPAPWIFRRAGTREFVVVTTNYWVDARDQAPMLYADTYGKLPPDDLVLVCNPVLRPASARRFARALGRLLEPGTTGAQSARTVTRRFTTAVRSSAYRRLGVVMDRLFPDEWRMLANDEYVPPLDEDILAVTFRNRPGFFASVSLIASMSDAELEAHVRVCNPFLRGDEARQWAAQIERAPVRIVVRADCVEVPHVLSVEEVRAAIDQGQREASAVPEQGVQINGNAVRWGDGFEPKDQT